LKAAVVYGQNDIRFEEVAKPVAGPGEIVVKVKASGVCATDVKILGGNGLPKDLPTILGHEVAGIIDELGEGVTGLELGQHVIVYPIATCGKCRFCREGRNSLCLHEFGLAHGLPGGFAEYVRVPREIIERGGIVSIGDFPFDLAAMIEPLSCTLSALYANRVKKGDTVAVVGVGPLGLLYILVNKWAGARVIAIDVNSDRLAFAQKIGADIIINSKETDPVTKVKEITEIGADAVVMALGIPEVIEASLPLVRNGGVFNIFGGPGKGSKITVDPRWLHYGEITLTGTFASSPETFRTAAELVMSGQIDVRPIVTDRFPLEKVVEAVEMVKAGKLLKGILVL
jgi:threonine dehydrogenase-like Zn-dependent dehydrogenase